MRTFPIPRVMIAAPGSGSGKTMVTCGLLQLMKEKCRTLSFKCGPDYIDPMFHRTVLGTPSRNLDSWLAPPEMVRQILTRSAAKTQAQMCVIEGVMGYYDGLGGNTTLGSSYELSVITQTPVILVVDAAGAGLSLAAVIRGLLEFRTDQQIRGVLLNRCTEKVFDALEPVIEKELGLAALGYIPRQEKIHFPGRHLGLMMPEEIADLQQKIDEFARKMEKTVDFDRILRIAQSAPEIGGVEETDVKDGEDDRPKPRSKALMESGSSKHQPTALTESGSPVRIGIARDEAFCFYYEDNLDLLQAFGAQLVPFSPLRDRKLPENLDGLYMGGGYPELHARALSENRPMRDAIAAAVDAGLPCLAECGAYMYLHEQMEDADGELWPMAGVIRGSAVRKERLVRFGYCELTAREETILGPAGTILRAHEFHYWDSDNQEGAFTACKPGRAGEWKCMLHRRNLLAGFPHLYFPGAPEVAENFVNACRKWQKVDKNGEK